MWSTVGDELAAQIAGRHFGISGTVRRLDGERDLNYRVSTDDGSRYVLKLHHPDSDPRELDLQNEVLRHLARSSVDLAPRVVSTASGQSIAQVEWVDGIRYARLLSWLDGVPWADSPATPERMTDLGRRLAEIDVALADFAHPADRRPELAWRITAAPQIAAQAMTMAGAIDESLRPVVARVVDRYTQHTRPALRGLPEQVVHHDANEHNILLDASGSVAGIIDFGDVVRVPRITELAVACAYAMQGHDDPIGAILPLVSGYDAIAPLGVAELDVLVDLIAVRLAMSVCMSARQLADDPANTYLGISQAGVRSALITLDGLDRELGTFRLRDHVGFEANPAARSVRQYFESGRAEPAPIVAAGTRPDVTTTHYGEQVTEGISLLREVAAVPDSPVYVPLDGVVFEVGDDRVATTHRTPDGTEFWTVIHGIVPGLEPGTAVERSQSIGRTGPAGRVGVQLATHRSGLTTPVRDGDADLWRSICPDPNLLIGDPDPGSVRPRRHSEDLARLRTVNFSRAMDISYRQPLHIVRGEGAYLFDRDGNRWLDLVNNVCHVGHAHPRVTAAAHRQATVLNTNTRYLHESIVEYARRIVELMPDPLRVCFFVNSGSEANDLALRLAAAHTGSRDVLVLDHAYHGNLSSLIGLSPYKFARSGGEGPPGTTWVCELPDVYRGRLRAGRDQDLAKGYAVSVDDRLSELHAAGRSPAAFFVESLQSCGGQIVLPDGYLRQTFAAVRAAGGICVADEVQVGLGRVGSHLWGFEMQGAVPDIVTLGKPLGNGHPLAAVITTPEVARSFETGMEWFNTFGGNPVSAEVGLSVLDVLRDEGLQANAAAVGDRMLSGLRELAARHSLIGDVRGAGLFIGIELSHDDRRPAAAEAAAVKEAAKRRGVLLSTDGPDGNVLKIKPPLVLSAAGCDHFLEVFDAALGAGEFTPASP
nr:aminotransferase class III-fold pyridoxal phosphate-dependent enzyme [Kribbella solani]